MSIRPSMRGVRCSSDCSFITLAVGLGAPSGPRRWATAEMEPAIARSAKAPTAKRMRAGNFDTDVLLIVTGRPPRRRSSCGGILVIGGYPAPSAGAVATFRDALFVDLRNDLAIPG